MHIADDKHAHMWSAPQEHRGSKRDVAALTQMPHLKKQDWMDKEHPAVLPRAELHKEEEGPITEELGDPVPRLSRSKEKGRAENTAATKQRRKPYIRDPSKAYRVTDAVCLTDDVEYNLRGAAPVGRCLDRHARDTTFSRTGKNGRECYEPLLTAATADGYGRLLHATTTVDDYGRGLRLDVEFLATATADGLRPDVQFVTTATADRLRPDVQFIHPQPLPRRGKTPSYFCEE